MTNKSTLIVHNLDEKKVKKSIEEQCVRFERNRLYHENWTKNYYLDKWAVKPPENPELAQQELENKISENIEFYAGMCEKELTYFSKVCVVEDTIKGNFYLNYHGGKEAEGTGPFETLAKAEAWFFGQGR